MVFENEIESFVRFKNSFLDSETDRHQKWTSEFKISTKLVVHDQSDSLTLKKIFQDFLTTTSPLTWDSTLKGA